MKKRFARCKSGTTSTLINLKISRVYAYVRRTQFYVGNIIRVNSLYLN